MVWNVLYSNKIVCFWLEEKSEKSKHRKKKNKKQTSKKKPQTNQAKE